MKTKIIIILIFLSVIHFTAKSEEQKPKIAETKTPTISELLERENKDWEEMNLPKNEIAGVRNSTPFVKNEWTTVEENINAFSISINSPLKNKYGKVFVEKGKKYGVHPYAIVAIGLADSSLGKNLTTPYNLGNVGNTDSCPTCRAYRSWDEGIESIAQTLSDSNPNLKNAFLLCHLSRGGWAKCPAGRQINKGFFYASSIKNWETNVNSTIIKLTNNEFNSTTFNYKI